MSHSDVAHHWANRVGTSAKGGNMYFEGERIYSYGKHFCIARLLPSNVVVFGTHSYSMTTSKHQSLARQAAVHRKFVYCYDPNGSAASNMAAARSEAMHLLVEADTKPRIRQTTRDQMRVRSAAVIQSANEYLAALPDNEKVGIQPLEIDPVQVENVKQARLREVAAEAERHRKRLEAERVRVEEWRRHEANGYLEATALRLSMDGSEVETSKGAHIPVNHARRLWPLIENVRAVGKPLVNRDMKLGVYTLTEIKVDGSIVVGCHNIPYSEIEGIARALGLLAETV